MAPLLPFGPAAAIPVLWRIFFQRWFEKDPAGAVSGATELPVEAAVLAGHVSQWGAANPKSAVACRSLGWGPFVCAGAQLIDAMNSCGVGRQGPMCAVGYALATGSRPLRTARLIAIANARTLLLACTGKEPEALEIYQRNIAAAHPKAPGHHQPEARQGEGMAS